MVGLMLSSCSNNDSESVIEGVKGVSTVTAETNASLPGVQNSFAWKYMSAVASFSDDKDCNIAVSPLSMMYALGMTANGAVGSTQSEITSALGYEGSINALNYYCKQAMERMQSKNDSAQVDIANCVEVNKNFAKTLKGDYTATIEDAYKALVESRDFSDSGFLDYINSWCSEHTDGMIPMMLEGDHSNSLIILMNALCFRGIWHNKFDVDNTTEGYFSLSSDASTKVYYMNQTGNFCYGEANNYKILSMDYGDGSYSMQFILPSKYNTVSSIAKQLSGQDWNATISSLKKDEVKVMLPRFTVDFDSKHLVNVLKSLGMTSMFSDEADFSNLVSNGGLCVSDVMQKVHIEVDEDGTRAAGATAVMMDGSMGHESSCNTFYATRPFLFVLTEKSTGTILFMGQYTGKE